MAIAVGAKIIGGSLGAYVSVKPDLAGVTLLEMHRNVERIEHNFAALARPRTGR